MAIINVEVPEKIAKKFQPFTVVSQKDFLSKTSEETVLPVNMDAQDFLNELEKEVIQY